ncbi:nucleotide sugar dehydrogenase [Prosthecobacter sp.]|uniref:nucleotide sugar dehydrogenase n=1 Tax=Prosthecobacter sp. TaxID=1965333 RepID=UPI002ABC288E|nr:nucleotide sugar dehydrogenase [Prosthecobacter sp.]MDZ4405810.1 nucleotide sugar dehydrogenase [Prosthecobacter sp.]
MPVREKSSAAVLSSWQKKLHNHSLKVGIMGMGYVGLPLGLLFAEKGFKVVGVDPDERRIRTLNQGRSPIRHIKNERVKAVVKNGTFQATAAPSGLSEVDVVLICVPTPLTKQREPDLSYVESASEWVAGNVKPGCLVILESTTYPGTTRDIVAPILRKAGLKPGTNVYLAYSPEREDPNNANFSTASIPKLVGGTDSTSGKLAVLLYEQIISKVIPVTSAEVAEAAKLLENIFRSVNIAMVNELKIVFDRMGIDIWEVVNAAKTKPFGFMPFYPGPGLGGHCIPIDPFYLTWKAREFDISTKFIELAGEVNTNMPYFVISKLQDALGSRGKSLRGSRVLLLGLAYKRDVDDFRESPTLKLMEILERNQCRVTFHDSFIPQFPGDHHFPALKPRKSVPLTRKNVAEADAVLICTDHSNVDYRSLAQWASIIVDTRNVMPSGGKNVFRA